LTGITKSLSTAATWRETLFMYHAKFQHCFHWNVYVDKIYDVAGFLRIRRVLSEDWFHRRIHYWNDETDGRFRTCCFEVIGALGVRPAWIDA